MEISCNVDWGKHVRAHDKDSDKHIGRNQHRELQKHEQERTKVLYCDMSSVYEDGLEPNHDNVLIRQITYSRIRNRFALRSGRSCQTCQTPPGEIETKK